MQTLSNLKALLKKDLGRSWATIIAGRCQCSPELVRAVFRQQLKDRRKIIETSIQIILDNTKDQEILSSKLDQITNYKKH